MDSDMKLYLSTSFRGEKGSRDTMRDALISIAKEIQRFRSESEAGKQSICKIGQGIDVPMKRNSNTKLDARNKVVKKLKHHVKTVCHIAKIILLAKNRETEHLVDHLNHIRNASSNLSRSNAENLALIQQLRMENFNITNDVQFLCHFIHLAYKKLQEMRDERPKDMSFIEELNAILLACGQYYSDYCNSRDRCAQLERRNRFLKNKLSIVENNLVATTEELRNLRSLNMKLRIKCETNHQKGEWHSKIPKRANVSDMTLGPVCGDRNKNDCCNMAVLDSIESKQEIKMPHKSICTCTYHLETIRNLLLDQDNMLKELKEMYLDVLTPESSIE